MALKALTSSYNYIGLCEKYVMQTDIGQHCISSRYNGDCEIVFSLIYKGI